MTTDKKKFVITQKFENVFKGDYGDLQTGEGHGHYDIEWRIRIFPQSPHFSIDLDCFVGPDYIKWAIDVEIEWRLFSENGWKPIGRSEYRITKREIPKISFDWKRHGDCFTDDTLIVECHVEINKMDGMERKNLRRFDESMEDVSDIVLVVEEERFYVSKLFLASQSSHFRTILIDNPSGSKEVIIDDVDALHFQYYLEVLYGNDPVDDDTVVFILFLGEKFDSQTVLDRCERFLIIETDMGILKELELALEYKLETLKDNILSELDSLEEIRRAVPEDVSEIPQAVMTVLFERIISFHR